MINSTRIPSRQRGAILVVSLLLLLVMTALALTASQTTRLQERMAGNSRDTELAFQAAEAALRDSERRIEKEAESLGRRIIQPCATLESCVVLNRPETPNDYFQVNQEWWAANALAYGDPTVKEFETLKEEPVSRAEEWVRMSDSLTDGAKPGQQTGTVFYVNTARSLGGTDTAEVVLQSVFATPYVE